MLCERVGDILAKYFLFYQETEITLSRKKYFLNIVFLFLPRKRWRVVLMSLLKHSIKICTLKVSFLGLTLQVSVDLCYYIFLFLVSVKSSDKAHRKRLSIHLQISAKCYVHLFFLHPLTFYCHHFFIIPQLPFTFI